MTMTTARTTSVDLSAHFDTTGFSPPDHPDLAAFNIWSNSFPYEQLERTPEGRVRVGAIDFEVAADGRGSCDHIRCAGQYLELPPGRRDWIHFLAAAERRTEDAVLLHFEDGMVDPEWLRVSDFWPQTPAWFGERDGLTFDTLHYPRHVQDTMGPSLWRTRVAVPRERTLIGLRLPDNPAIHVFAIELEPSRWTS
jgi:hypothetical protein